MPGRTRILTSPSASPSPQRLRLFVHEKGITRRLQEIVHNMAPGSEQHGWHHLKMDP